MVNRGEDQGAHNPSRCPCGLRPADAPQENPTLVRQEDAEGCAVAVIAMLAGRTYADVRDEIDGDEGHGHNGDWSREGVTYITVDQLLGRAGFFMQKRYGEAARTPFAPVHYAQTLTPSNRHFIVVLRDGTVLDPLRDEPGTLADYDVQMLVGVVSPAAGRSAERARLASMSGENPYPQGNEHCAWRDGSAIATARTREAERARLAEIDVMAFGKATCARFTYAEDQPYEAVGDRDSLRLRAFLDAYLRAALSEGGTDA